MVQQDSIPGCDPGDGGFNSPSPDQPKTRVVNRNFELYDVYIGRPSKWGNPFIAPTSRMDSRLEVIRAYREWITHNSELLADLHELKGKRLGCYCKPKPCHGDVLVALVEELCDTKA